MSTSIHALLEALRSHSWRIATAESLTGGGIGAALTAVPGSSEWFAGGVIAYQSEQKTRQLGVPPAVIAQHGVVSREVVAAMAAGVRQRFDVEVAVAVSGVAGPGGGSAQTPVGTVWIAVSAPGASIEQRYHFAGNRDEVRQHTITAAINLLVKTTA
ncbi:MAG: CinA family protein [Actinomycetes bacterium]|nr:CinA family protein [Actinomycetes bacterium]